MATFLIHIHTGHADPNKATLGLLVALAAKDEGHDVTVFLAGDGVHLLAPANRDLEGEGTGVIGAHLDRHAEAGTPFLVSGKSAKARGFLCFSCMRLSAFRNFFNTSARPRSS